MLYRKPNLRDKYKATTEGKVLGATSNEDIKQEIKKLNKVEKPKPKKKK